MIQQYGFPFVAIIQRNMERTTQGNNQLFQTFMSMAASTFTRRNIIDPIGPFDVKRHLITSLSNGQVTTRICDFRQIYYLSL